MSPPEILDRLIHNVATAARLPLVILEKGAARLPHAQVLRAADD